MFLDRSLRADLLLALSYFLLASLAVSLTRFDGGVAFLWVATALLIPALVRRPRRRWGMTLALSGLASCAATGLFGLGWTLAIPFAVINLTEAYLGATLLSRTRSAHAPMRSLGWLASFVLSVGLVAPAVAALLAGLATSGVGRAFFPTFIDFFAGHALGNLTFAPVFTLIISGRLRAMLRGLGPTRAIETAALLALVAASCLATFSISQLPLLFLPCGPIILAIFRGREVGAAGSIVLLALIGGGFTAAGHGPIQLIDSPIGERMQFFQFYLAAVVLTVLPVTADLRNRARLHRELRHSEERYRMLADHSSDILMHLDRHGIVRFVSPSIRQLGGYEPREMTGRPAIDFIVPDDIGRVRRAHAETVAAGGQTRRFDYRATLGDGSERWFETHSRAILDGDGRFEGVLSVVRDVTDGKLAEERLLQAAMTDSLTGLPNRRAFWEAAERHLAGPGEASAGCIAILDLDHFKLVNDVHGHDVGDAVLRQFAVQAASCLRDGDIVARLGGEEFGLLLPRTDLESAARICERLRESVAQMGVPSRSGLIRVTISGGVSVLGPDGLDTALRCADLALYEAKSGGRDQLCLAA